MKILTQKWEIRKSQNVEQMCFLIIFDDFVSFYIDIPSSVTSNGRESFRKKNENFDSVDLFISYFPIQITQKCLPDLEKTLPVANNPSITGPTNPSEDTTPQTNECKKEVIRMSFLSRNQIS